MSSHGKVRGGAALSLALLVVLATSFAAAAHEEKHVRDLQLVVGFGTEPAYAGQPNSVQLILSHHGQPVTDLTDSLKVEVSFGDQSTQLTFEPFFEIGEFGTPGDYRAWFVPSQPGDYEFRIHGTVDGERVNETFRSGPKTFSSVDDLANAMFPEVTAPTNEQLAQRIDAEAARTKSAVAAATAAANAADDAASSARTVGIIGVILGAIGTIAAIGAIATTRRRPA
jgi:hypothetical protein